MGFISTLFNLSISKNNYSKMKYNYNIISMYNDL